MPALTAPTKRLHAAWLAAHAEWGPGCHEDGFGLLPEDDVESPAGFEAWLERLDGESARCTYRWVVDGGQVLGGIALRHEGNETVDRAGHIGFGIRPSARGRGLGTWALGQMLGEARRLEMDRVLLVCAAGNVASAATIERRGGVRESASHSGAGKVWRYWISIGQAAGRD